MNRSPLFHVGIVVQEIEAAQAHFSSLLGVTWGPIVWNTSMAIRDANGRDGVVDSRVCYSTEPPYLELLEERPGTAWECNDYSNLHHIGFFTEDLARGSDEFVRAGCPLLLAGRIGDASPMTFTYHMDDYRVRIEQVDAAMKGAIEKKFCRPPAGLSD